MSLDILKGLATTLKNMGKKPTTISYPEQERELPPRFRGRHVLHRYDNGLERCVGCYLCAGACPADAIYIEAEENTEENRVSPGERYARVFDVNMLRCIFCGYCQAACPTGAITLEQNYKLAAYFPEDMVYHKEMLLEPQGQSTIGSNTVWAEPAPHQAAQPIPQEAKVFDGSQASAAAVGLGNLTTECPVFFVSAPIRPDNAVTCPPDRVTASSFAQSGRKENEEQDEDRRKFEQRKDEVR